ncbi:unnamed protein product [Haemonchus placei]|uniref:Uncharacterized protein n=1 Tax=Haemonchus placei TaxID=6290 RepID=A0A3P7X5Q2_HAEPC|nr:unnamed protein product [Haemonchus placei]
MVSCAWISYCIDRLTNEVSSEKQTSWRNYKKHHFACPYPGLYSHATSV